MPKLEAEKKTIVVYFESALKNEVDKYIKENFKLTEQEAEIIIDNTQITYRFKDNARSK